MNYLYFHLPSEPDGYLSNWYPCTFTIDNITYNCSEQYMMYKKALLFHDEACAKKIMDTSDPSIQQKLGSSANNFNQKVWDGVKSIIVYEACLAKFSQNEDLKKKLLSTNQAILVEASESDDVWGIGINIHDPIPTNMKKWPGQNLLGFALMMVRDKLSKEQ